jgi:polysaccharide export outer membrane protein
LAQYRLRPNDQVRFTYVVSRRKSDGDYRLMIGDSVMVSLVSDAELQLGTLERGLEIQPDGYIHLDVLEQPVFAAGLTIMQLRAVLEQRYSKYYRNPAVNVKPVKTSTLADDIRNAIGGASGLQQQADEQRVAPDGTVSLAWIGRVQVQGLTLEEVAAEVNARYAAAGAGLIVTPSLTQQADHFVYVMGHVATPGRIQLRGPTTVSMAIAAAGGWQPEGNLRQVVIFRRAEDWRLVATMLDLRGAWLGKRPTPADEIWLRDGDVVIIPPTPITIFENFVRQVFTEGAYAVVPFQGFSINIGDPN